MLLSVIIPTLNESALIAKTIQHLRQMVAHQSQVEIMVIDSGSADKTTEIVSKMKNVSIYFHPELKGKKYAILNKGVSYANGDTFLFLDADTLVPKNFDRLIANQAIAEGYVGGAFEFKLDGRGIAMRFIELVNRIRYRLGKRYYGDQGIFCTRKAFEKSHGFPERLILESAHFCNKLSQIGSLKLIKENAVTSSRRFEQDKIGPLWLLTKDTWIFLKDIFGFKNEKFARRYWQKNDQEAL